MSIKALSGLGLIAGAAMLAAASVAPAQAQGDSRRLVRRTCTDIHMRGDHLIANCRRVDGSWARTGVNVDRCRGGVSQHGRQPDLRRRGRAAGRVTTAAATKAMGLRMTTGIAGTGADKLRYCEGAARSRSLFRFQSTSCVCVTRATSLPSLVVIRVCHTWVRRPR